MYYIEPLPDMDGRERQMRQCIENAVDSLAYAINPLCIFPAEHKEAAAFWYAQAAHIACAE